MCMYVVNPAYYHYRGLSKGGICLTLVLIEFQLKLEATPTVIHILHTYACTYVCMEGVCIRICTCNVLGALHVYDMGHWHEQCDWNIPCNATESVQHSLDGLVPCHTYLHTYVLVDMAYCWCQLAVYCIVDSVWESSMGVLNRGGFGTDIYTNSNWPYKVKIIGSIAIPYAGTSHTGLNIGDCFCSTDVFWHGGTRSKLRGFAAVLYLVVSNWPE